MTDMIVEITAEECLAAWLMVPFFVLHV